jgi:hypothetical protein
MEKQSSIASRLLTRSENLAPSEECAREFSLVVESTKAQAEAIRAELMRGEQLVRFYERHGEDVDFFRKYSVFEQRSMPSLVPYALKLFRRKFVKEDKLLLSIERMSKEQWDQFWNEVVDKAEVVAHDALLCPYQADFSVYDRYLLVSNDDFDGRRNPFKNLGIDENTDWPAIRKNRPSAKELKVLLKARSAREHGKSIISGQRNKEGVELFNGGIDYYCPNVEVILGERLAGVFADMLPPEFVGLVGSISLRPEIKTTVEAGLDGNSSIQANGTFDLFTKQIALAINDESQFERVVQTFVHELGHAFAFPKNEGVGMRIRHEFAKVAAKETNHTSFYAVHSGAHRGIESGLGEDFAESFMFYILAPSILQDRNPMRARLLEDLMQRFYPGVDIRLFRDRIQREIKKGLIRRAESPGVFTQTLEASEQGWEQIYYRFPGQMYRLLEHVLERSPGYVIPDEQEVRYVQGTQIKIVKQFDDLARAQEERMEVAGEIIGRNFYDPSYDEQGRLLSFKHELREEKFEIFFSYTEDYDIPQEATVVKGSLPITTVRYEQYGYEVKEIAHDLQLGISSEQVYTLVGQGDDQRISFVEGSIQGSPVFQRRFFYDKNARSTRKTFDTHDGKQLKSNEYTYEQEL